MNFTQKSGLFILIVISVLYVYFAFFNNEFKLPDFGGKEKNSAIYNPAEKQEAEINIGEVKNKSKNIKIFILDKSGNLRSVNRACDASVERSCFKFAIQELLTAPSSWEKSKGFTSEIPYGTKLLSVRESSAGILIDLSSDFETGGGAESTYMRIKQLIKTANINASVPVYLYINGKQADVIGGEGVMIKQPMKGLLMSNGNLKKDLDYYLNLNWTLIEGTDLDFNGNPYHYIEIKEIPSFAFCAKTREKALENYKKQLRLSLMLMLEDGDHIIEPGEETEDDIDWESICP